LNKRFQRLPPVKAVQALEALDRLGSLLAVADEMALTRPAVSHMLRRLETELGFALTEADGRSVRLTGRAKRYVDHTRKALVIMREAASDSEHRLAGELKIVCTPGLATFWLAPRLARFSSKHRDIRLTIATSRTLGEIQDETADVQLAYGDEALLRASRRFAGKGVVLSGVCTFYVNRREGFEQSVGPLPVHSVASGDECALAELAESCRRR
jgi:DNA-binding transcriptional LysR family regulator